MEFLGKSLQEVTLLHKAILCFLNKLIVLFALPLVLNNNSKISCIQCNSLFKKEIIYLAA